MSGQDVELGRVQSSAATGLLESQQMGGEDNEDATPLLERRSSGEAHAQPQASSARSKQAYEYAPGTSGRLFGSCIGAANYLHTTIKARWPSLSQQQAGAAVSGSAPPWLAVVDSVTLGMLLYAASTVFLSIQSVCSKLLGARQMPVFESVLARSAIILLFSSAPMAYHKESPVGKRPHMLFLRGLFGFGSISCLYWVVDLLPLSDAMVLTFLAPLIVACLGPMVLKEPFAKVTVYAIPLSVLGVVLIAKPTALFGRRKVPISSKGVFIGCLQPIFSAAAKMMVRLLRKTETTAVIVFYMGFVCTLCASVACIALHHMFRAPANAAEWVLLIGSGCCGYASQLTMTMGLQRVDAAPATLLSYLSVVWGELAGWVIFKERPSALSVFGTLLVCSMDASTAPIAAAYSLPQIWVAKWWATSGWSRVGAKEQECARMMSPARSPTMRSATQDCRAECRLVMGSPQARQEISLSLSVAGATNNPAPAITLRQAGAVLRMLSEPLAMVRCGLIARRFLPSPTLLQSTGDKGHLVLWLMPNSDLRLVWQRDTEVTSPSSLGQVWSMQHPAMRDASPDCGPARVQSPGGGGLSPVYEVETSLEASEELLVLPARDGSMHSAQSAPDPRVEMLSADNSGRSFRICLPAHQQPAASAANPALSPASPDGAQQRPAAPEHHYLHFWLADAYLEQGMASLQGLMAALSARTTLSEQTAHLGSPRVAAVESRRIAAEGSGRRLQASFSFAALASAVLTDRHWRISHTATATVTATVVVAVEASMDPVERQADYARLAHMGQSLARAKAEASARVSVEAFGRLRLEALVAEREAKALRLFRQDSG
ncbi:hypothetical protein WJX72_003023 [[Myrmecia] bisecta]|uniref:EamA domain-containing protein n=1 Tax=[Myrmecia] bisecta TaxID=41462 RepID=A0AAW1R5U9_9CHLO